MELNSAVKRNNPVWDKSTVTFTLAIPGAGPPAIASLELANTGTAGLDIRGTYVIICNRASNNMQIMDTSSVGAGVASSGILLPPGATFECAINLSPSTTEGITVLGTSGDAVTVTYFA